MDIGCCWNVITKLVCFDSGDDHVKLGPNDRGDDDDNSNDDGQVGAELLGAPQEGISATVYNNDGKDPHDLAVEAGYSDAVSVMPYPLQPETDVARADVEMESVKRELVGISRSLATQWNELYTEIMKGAKDVIKTRLIKHGKKLLWCQDKQTGKTLLHVAAEAGHVKQIVQFMVNNGLTGAALLGDRDGDTALHLALQCGDLTEARYLIKAAPRTVYQVNHKGISPLYLATKFGRQDLVMYMLQMVERSLLPACASEIVRHPKNAALAYLAIKARDLVTLKTLMEHLPDLFKATNEKGWRPLSYAANKGYLDEVTYLLTNFPESAEKHDKDGYLPIHKAVGGGHVSIIKAFYKHCPQTLHHIDRKGRNVLHIAVSYNRANIVTYLTKEFKLDDSFLNLKDNKGRTFMDYAEELENELVSSGWLYTCLSV